MRNRLLSNPYLCAGLAQLVEQLTFNQLVRGSSPRPGTKTSLMLEIDIFQGIYQKEIRAISLLADDKLLPC